jgi:hypothetical protein
MPPFPLANTRTSTTGKCSVMIHVWISCSYLPMHHQYAFVCRRNHTVTICSPLRTGQWSRLFQRPFGSFLTTNTSMAWISGAFAGVLASSPCIFLTTASRLHASVQSERLQSSTPPSPNRSFMLHIQVFVQQISQHYPISWTLTFLRQHGSRRMPHPSPRACRSPCARTSELL